MQTAPLSQNSDEQMALNARERESSMSSLVDSEKGDTVGHEVAEGASFEAMENNIVIAESPEAVIVPKDC